MNKTQPREGQGAGCHFWETSWRCDHPELEWGKGTMHRYRSDEPFCYSKLVRGRTVRALRKDTQARQVSERLRGQRLPLLINPSSIVWETTGAVNTEGEELFATHHEVRIQETLGREHSSFCGRQWARLSCCLQRSVAKMILLRISSANCSNTLARFHPLLFPFSLLTHTLPLTHTHTLSFSLSLVDPSLSLSLFSLSSLSLFSLSFSLSLLFLSLSLLFLSLSLSLSHQKIGG